MSDSIKQNFFNKQFGLNIKVPTRTIEQGTDTIKHQVEGVFEPLIQFINNNDHQSVFTGKVAKQIENYNLNIYNTGVALRVDTPSLDMKG